ncbi:hypothetical protein L6164_000419 [Bauhinia variegata]|uniref:Uncharacterized protein n=1 Tax=Bauhinia variegata TaxID=167791 RepID=A0ACB9Q6F2_BAUVA|nr:hypothetical protein L6164_000419 [Bauhinia variegata]
MNSINPCEMRVNIPPMNWSPFSYSQINEVIVFGCDEYSSFKTLISSENDLCLAGCHYVLSGDILSCDISYCCQASLPLSRSKFDITTVRMKGTDEPYNSYPCVYLLMVDSNWLANSMRNNFSLVLEHVWISRFVPAVLDWGIPFFPTSISMLQNVKNCHDYTFNTSSGIQLLRGQCQCPLGIKGNPYIGGERIGDSSDAVEEKRQALARIITVSSTGPDGYARSLASYFITCMNENSLFDILDDNVLKEGDTEHIMLIANIAKSCLSLHGKERPTMGEVTMELARIQNLRNKSNNHHESEGINLDTYLPRDIKHSASLNLDFISNSETSSSNILSMLNSTYPFISTARS